MIRLQIAAFAKPYPEMGCVGFENLSQEMSALLSMPCVS